MSRPRNGGFTLVEIMVAMFVFATLAAVSYATLGGIAQTIGSVSEQMLRLQSLQRTLQSMQLDFTQLNPRPVREELASQASGALSADLRSEYLVELTRGGWTNPLVLPRPALQRVAYYVDEDRLVRVQWPALDRLLSNEPVEYVLLKGVEAISIRYLTGSGDWSESWPAGRGGGQSLRALPRAVEVVLELRDYGEIRRLFEVTG